MDAGETILTAFSNQTGDLTKEVKVVDNGGNATGEKKPRFILQSGGYLGKIGSPAVHSFRPDLTLPRLQM